MYEKDLPQMKAAERYLKCRLENKQIGRKLARELLGEKEYMSALNRAAFHWTASRLTKDGREIIFDCSGFFRSHA